MKTPTSTNKTYTYTIFKNEITAKNVISILTQAQSILEDKEVKKLVMDLQKVNYITSSGIGMLLEICYQAASLDKDFSICNINPEIQDALQLTMIHTVIKIEQ